MDNNKRIYVRRPARSSGVSKTQLGIMLSTARVIKNLTLKNVAGILGFSDRTLCHIERGDYTLSAKHIDQISNILGLDKKIVAALAIQETPTFKKYAKIVGLESNSDNEYQESLNDNG